MLPRHRALALLSECTGETLWPISMCQDRGIPQAWIDELADAFESGFDHDRDTIYRDDVAYVRGEPLNQFHGIRDVDLACRLGHELGVDIDAIVPRAIGRAGMVAAIKEAVMDG